jgi:hypothetical protein
MAPQPATLLTLTLALACSGSAPTASNDPPAGGDVTTPFPMGHVGSGPSTYKGLPLALVHRAEPAVTPVDGVIGVVCIGMSNGNQECTEWIQQLAGAWGAEVNPAVRVINCAVGGHAIEKWIDPVFDATLWQACITQRLPQAGVRLDQVRVLWHKAASQFTTAPGGGALPPYPAADSDYYDFTGYLDQFAGRVSGFFPAVQAVYTSSRSYGGFSSNPGRGEPLSYEEGHALNGWLAGHATVGGVWHGWGAYLWAPSCDRGVVSEGNCYVRDDYQSDGTHPAAAGRVKIARLIHERFLQAGWYRR